VCGLSDLLKDDRKLLHHCGVIFDGLYALLTLNAGNGMDKRDGSNKRGARRSAGRRKERP
jgi:hypothetical protein